MIKYKSVQEIIELAEKENTTISKIVLRETALATERSEEDICNEMYTMLDIMEKSINDGVNKKMMSFSGLTGGMGTVMKDLIDSGRAFSGTFMSQVIMNAIAVAEVNASMGKIVAAPTAGSCGIVPACLISLQRHYNIDREKIMMGLINASAIGLVVANNASISGAEGGCQAECGTSAAMAASAMAEILGGSPKVCGDAAGQALKSLMGLVCDPVAGLVEEPCVVRNASSATVAVTSAEIALAGIASIIPVDEVIIAMGEVGKNLPPCLRETAEGGIAASPTAKAIEERLSKNKTN